ncbi:MAG: stage V sporulation protein AB [Clostridiales bacterium]|jgi:stage V sporulation protein AB|nr:stage V sporulation protein AB [Clostridiales bacterium]
MILLKNILLAFLGFSSGIVISGAVFAFIAIIGVVPRLAQKTQTQNSVKIYEEMIIAGGIIGSLPEFWNIKFEFPKIIAGVFGLGAGIFYGCVAVCLAEILDVIPITARRANVKNGFFLFITALALGKLAGALMYFFVSGFFEL